MTGLFPPGKGGGEEVAYGGKGKGILIHTLTEGNGMPLANCTTPANGNEREQVIPLLDKVKLKTLKRGRPRRRIKVLAADKGYDSKQKRADLRFPSIRPQIPKRVWKTKKNRGRPIKISVPRFQQERILAMPAAGYAYANEKGLINWDFGAVDGSFSPWEGRG
ncbi:transposase [Nostoc punctiforme UO1]|uniref:transposase n=1 Tax=Nostoc punctiforme TaxID=272131 RepID=UPI003099E723